MKKTEQLTHGELRISPGTLYRNLPKMEKDGLIHFVRKKEIFCDDASRIIFFLSIIPQFILQSQTSTPKNSTFDIFAFFLYIES